MEKIVKIKDIKLRNFNNAEYTQFLSNTEQLLQTAGAGHLRIDAGLLAEFRDNIQKLTDISFQSRASTETEELAKLDKQRDDLAVYLLAAFRVERKSPITPRREALHHYQKLHRCAVSAEPTRNAGAGRLGNRP